MNKADVAKFVSKLRFAIPVKARRLNNPEGPEGRLDKMRKLVTGLIKYERIEVAFPKGHEARCYAERVSSTEFDAIAIDSSLNLSIDCRSSLRPYATATHTNQRWKWPNFGCLKSSWCTNCSKYWCRDSNLVPFHIHECTGHRHHILVNIFLWPYWSCAATLTHHSHPTRRETAISFTMFCWTRRKRNIDGRSMSKWPSNWHRWPAKVKATAKTSIVGHHRRRKRSQRQRTVRHRQKIRIRIMKENRRAVVWTNFFSVEYHNSLSKCCTINANKW